MTKKLRFALFGTGFWSRFQMAGWNEVGGVECVALCDRTIDKAREFAGAVGLHAEVYDDPRKLFENEILDFVDIVTSPDSHSHLTILAASFGVAVVCQKPMALSLGESENMVRVCRSAGVPLFINENWRWQAPIRRLKQIIEEGSIGTPYRARIRMVSGFPVFANQPSLKELDRFLLVDVGSHILDVARYLFGEPESVYCQTQRIQRGVLGEDVATVMLKMLSGETIICEMGLAGAPLEVDHFPQTFALIEGDRGSVELAPEYKLRITTSLGTKVVFVPPEKFAWADSSYQIVHSSLVTCQANLLSGLRREQVPETNGEDNLRTMRLVYESYESARRNEVIHL